MVDLWKISKFFGSWLALALALVGVLLLSGKDSLESTHLGPSLREDVTWLPTFPLPHAIAGHSTVIMKVDRKEYIYTIGGARHIARSDEIAAIDEVHYAPVNQDGSVGQWQETKHLQTSGSEHARRAFHASVVLDGRTYVMGGYDGGDFVDTVLFAEPDGDGSIGEWLETESLPQPMDLFASVVYSGRIYVIGGCSDGRRLGTVYSARPDEEGYIREDRGWRPEKSLGADPTFGLSSHAVIADENGGYIYVLGGKNDRNEYQSTVYRAKIESQGFTGEWHPVIDRAIPVRPQRDGLVHHSAVLSSRSIYVIGGVEKQNGGNLTNSDRLHVCSILAGGELSKWQTFDISLPYAVQLHSSPVVQSGILYLVGGALETGDQEPLYSLYRNVYYTPLVQLVKTAYPAGPVTYGDTINYTLELTNLGVRDFKTLDITDTVTTDAPTVLEFDYPPQCRMYSDNTITCTVRSLGIGATEDLDFSVTISQPAPTSLQVPLAASTRPTTTWEQGCAAARLEVVGVGISDTLKPLDITDPATISGTIRAQAAFKITSGGKLDGVTFFCDGDSYAPVEPPSTYSFTTVYEQDFEKCAVISVTYESVGNVQASGLSAYYLRRTEEEHSLVGGTMCQSRCGGGYTDTYTHVLTLPYPVHSGDITVKAVLTDNNDPERVIRLTAQAGGVIASTTISTPSHGDCLDIRELQLTGVPTTTNVITVVAESPPAPDGESFSLVGLVAETGCTSTPPLRVVNRAEVCEHATTGSWCWDAIYINTPWRIYLPVVLKSAP